MSREKLKKLDFVEVVTRRTDQDMPWMPSLPSEYITWKQVERFAASFAIESLDPEERLDRYIFIALDRAGSAVIAIDFRTQ